MRFLYSVGVIGLDLHKEHKPKLPTSGGICVAFGVLSGLLTYIGLQTYLGYAFRPIYDLENWLVYILAVTTTIVIVMFVGLLDDLNVKPRLVQTKEGQDIRVGIPQWLKPLLTLPAAIPLMVLQYPHMEMAIPFWGVVNVGPFLYPLLIIPVGVVGASNAVNLLAGFNGLEAGMGIIYFLGLGVYAALHRSIGAVVFLIAFAALVGFIRYNVYPARILPGDSLTYLLGSVVAAGVIVGNMERSGIIVMLPFIIEFFLKSLTKFKATSIGRLRKDGKLDSPYGRRVYSWTHVLMNLGAFTERQVTILLILIQLCFVILLFLGIM
ncbi:MAG: hypothetical protein JSV58_04050, partial [Candidatus Bathyarchaeota archaeon]